LQPRYCEQVDRLTNVAMKRANAGVQQLHNARQSPENNESFADR
jgi:hypothetical protein